MRPTTAMRMLLFPLMFAAATWGAPILTYEGSMQATSGDGTSLDQWSFVMPLTPGSEVVLTADDIVGTPYPDAVFDGGGFLVSVDPAIESVVSVGFSSPTIGLFRYSSLREPKLDHVGSFDISGWVFGGRFEMPYTGSLVIHTPEPATLIITASALLSALILRHRRMAHRRNARGYSNSSRSSIQ